MLRNYLIVAYRNLMRHTVYSLINVAGLSIGIAFCILTFLYVRHEWTYDAFHENADRLYRAYTVDRTGASDWTPVPLGPALEAAFPDVRTVRVGSGGSAKYQDRAIDASFQFADPAILKVFSFPLIQGDPESVFEDPYSLVVTEAASRRYFGDEDPIGKLLTIEFWGRPPVARDFVVTGIAKSIPGNSSIRFDFLSPLAAKPDPRGSSWAISPIQTFVFLPDHVRPADVELWLSKLPKTRWGERWDESVGLQPLLEMHLNRDKTGPVGAGNPAFSYIILGIALLVLTIACVNFITLAVGRSFSRDREVAMRKVAGATRIQLVTQFLGESMALSVLALVAGVCVAEIFLPVFNSVVVKDLSLHHQADGAGMAFLIGLAVTVGLAAGGYPAFVLSDARAAAALKGRIRHGGSNRFGRALVVLQFALSIFLVVSALMMVRQVEYLRTKPLGFDSEYLVRIFAFDPLRPDSQTHEVYRNELSEHHMILGVTTTSHTLNNWARSPEIVEHDEKKIDVEHISVGDDFLETMGVSLLEGNDFDSGRAGSSRSIFINESLARRLGWKRPVAGRLLRRINRDYTVIGVVNDFHFRSLHQPIGPLVLSFNPRSSRHVFVRIRAANVSATLALLKEKWREVAPGREFHYSFLDDDLDTQYRNEERWSRIIGYATLLAVFIACLGAFGLTALAVARRTREIGIRKVLGARVFGIVSLLSRDFVKLVVIASLIAFPVAYYATEQWLRDFAYRIDPQVSTFALGGGIVLLAVLLTVSVQAIRAAWANPVDALRTE